MNPGGAPDVRICEEKQRLLREYESSTQRYTDALRDLFANMGTSPKPVYDAMFAATEEARTRSEAVRKALLGHIHEHGC